MGRGLIVLVFLLAACSSAQPGNGVSYQTYGYSCCLEIGSSTTTWHPAQHVTLHWRSQQGQLTSDSTPHAVSLEITLTGPFTTVNQLKQASSGGNPPGVRAIKAGSLSVTDRTGGAPATELDLPADLAPGYYNLSSLQTIGGTSAGGATIVVIQ